MAGFNFVHMNMFHIRCGNQFKFRRLNFIDDEKLKNICRFTSRPAADMSGEKHFFFSLTKREYLHIYEQVFE